MVRIAFVVEGDVEKMFIEQLEQTQWLKKRKIIRVGPIVNVRGGGNLCPQRIEPYLAQVKTFDPDVIVILTDLECDPCVTQTRQRIGQCLNCKLVVARKAIEAWYLADQLLMEKLLSQPFDSEIEPESTPEMPFETIRQLLIQHTGRGADKKMLARRAMKTFSIDRAAAHPNCPSAAYFVNKLSGLHHTNV